MYEENEAWPFTIASIWNGTFNQDCYSYISLGKKCHRKNPYLSKILRTDFCTHLSRILKLLCKNYTVFQSMYLTQFNTMQCTTVASYIETFCCAVSYSITTHKNHQCILEYVICETLHFQCCTDGIFSVLFHNTATC